jgi:hypothetical protein
MTQLTMIEQANGPLPDAGARVNRGIVWWARLGYAAKGIVFFVLGWLVCQRMLAPGGKPADPQGALRAIGEPPLGVLALGVLVVGLVGYALWEVIRAITDPEAHGRSPRSLARRAGFLLTGLAYAGLAFSALCILLGVHIGSSDQAVEEWTAHLLAQPFGLWLVGLAGAAVVGVGFYQFYKAYKGSFLRDLRLDEMSDNARRLAIQSGRLGYVALGSVMTLIGLLLLRAAVQFNPQAAGSWREALQLLAHLDATRWLLGVIALGLAAYGFYMLLLARYANGLFVCGESPPDRRSG